MGDESLIDKPRQAPAVGVAYATNYNSSGDSDSRSLSGPIN
ncbi:hypothetical protein [Spirosoma flavus]